MWCRLNARERMTDMDFVAQLFHRTSLPTLTRITRVMVHHEVLYLKMNVVFHPEYAYRGWAVHIAIRNASKPKVTRLPYL
jgi:hypothetical protein